MKLWKSSIKAKPIGPLRELIALLFPFLFLFLFFLIREVWMIRSWRQTTVIIEGIQIPVQTWRWSWGWDGGLILFKKHLRSCGRPGRCTQKWGLLPAPEEFTVPRGSVGTRRDLSLRHRRKRTIPESLPGKHGRDAESGEKACELQRKSIFHPGKTFQK